jgi:hypothetical protein
MNLFLNHLYSSKSTGLSLTRLNCKQVRGHSIHFSLDCTTELQNPGSVNLSIPGLHLGTINRKLVVYWASAMSQAILVLHDTGLVIPDTGIIKIVSD